MLYLRRVVYYHSVGDVYKDIQSESLFSMGEVVLKGVTLFFSIPPETIGSNGL